MLEKIDKIQALLNVPNVDADPKTAIANMKILNLLVDLRAQTKQLILSGVVGRSEQLVCPNCGSQNVYEFTYTDGIGCNSCGHQFQIMKKNSKY